MNAIKKGSVKCIEQPAETLAQKKVNIEAFLTAAASYGVPESKLFHLFDLLLLQNIPRVTACKTYFRIASGVLLSALSPQVCLSWDAWLKRIQCVVQRCTWETCRMSPSILAQSEEQGCQRVTIST